MTVFDKIFAIVVGFEGGFTDNPSDPGNWTGGNVGTGDCKGTKFGISAAAYPTVDIADLSLADAQAIYRADYWDHVFGDRLSPSLALLTFDAAVVCGVGRAVRWLQEAACVAADGVIGPVTLSAIGKTEQADNSLLCVDVLARRIEFMTSLPEWRTFGNGWSRRLARLPYQSLALME